MAVEILRSALPEMMLNCVLVAIEVLGMLDE